MTTESQNPYAVAIVESEPTIETSVPLSTYGYALVVFFIGWFAAGFVFIWPFACSGLDEVSVFLLTNLLSLPCGYFAGRGMYRKLADIHRRKVAWQREQAERLGEFY